MERQFADVAMRCDSVLCCRMSPSQKALVIIMVYSVFVLSLVFSICILCKQNAIEKPDRAPGQREQTKTGDGSDRRRCQRRSHDPGGSRWPRHLRQGGSRRGTRLRLHVRAVSPLEAGAPRPRLPLLHSIRHSCHVLLLQGMCLTSNLHNEHQVVN